MSHYIEPTQAPHGGFGKLSTRQLVEIIVGVAAVIALGIAAFALVNNVESSVVELANPSAVQSAAGTANLVTHGALDPFETELISRQLASGVDATAGSSPLPIVTHGALDPLETQLISRQLTPGLDTPSELIEDEFAHPRLEFR